MEEHRVADTDSINDEIIDVHRWITFLWNNKPVFIKITAVFCLIGIAVALLIPKKYTSVATILPSDASNKSAILSQIKQLTGGLTSSEIQVNALYPKIATSRTIINRVLDSAYENQTYYQYFIDAYDIKTDKGEYHAKETILKRLKGSMISTDVDRLTSVVTLSVTAKDPQFAASLCNEILHQSDSYLRANLKSSASDQANMINSRLMTVADSLKKSENVLRDFKEKNRTTYLSPSLQIEEIRLMREVEVNSAIYVELTKQLEIVKIEENQLKPALNILDEAVPPIKRSSPNRKAIVLIFMMLGFGVSFPVVKANDIKAYLKSSLSKS